MRRLRDEENARESEARWRLEWQVRWNGFFKDDVGDRYYSLEFDQYEISTTAQQTVYNRVREFCGLIKQHVKDGHGLVLFGNAGTGKDHLAICAAKAALIEFLPVKWRSGADLFGDFRDSMKSDCTEREMIKRFVDPAVLVISDPLPPSGGLTDFQRQQLFRILDGRYRMQKATWATINIANRQELDERLGVQLADRLLDGALAIPCNWPSYRSTRRIQFVTDVSGNDASAADEA